MENLFYEYQTPNKDQNGIFYFLMEKNVYTENL